MAVGKKMQRDKWLSTSNLESETSSWFLCMHERGTQLQQLIRIRFQHAVVGDPSHVSLVGWQATPSQSIVPMRSINSVQELMCTSEL
jgi:hypothetical protein